MTAPLNIPIQPEPTRYSAHPRRTCHQLGVCMHPSHSCAGACEQAAMQSLGVEGPYYPKRTRADRLATAAGAAVLLAAAGVSGWALGTGLLAGMDWLDALPSLHLLGLLGLRGLA